MRPNEGETTDGALLERLGDWADHAAWSAFVRRYDGPIRRVVASYRFDAHEAEEVCQRIWIELAGRMRGYRYDPSRRFRGWLGRLCRSRAIDQWRRLRVDAGRGEAVDLAAIPDLDDDEPRDDPARPALLLQATRAQQAVRARVDDRTWDVFWRIVVEDAPVAEVAQTAGLTYAAAFAAQKRVRRMLREESSRATIPTAAFGADL